LVDVLHRAAAAGAEKRAARLDPGGRVPLDPQDLGELERGLLPVRGVLDLFARDRTIDEDRLALDVRDAAPFPVERLDQRLRHQLQRPTNSRECGSPGLASVSRTSWSSLRYCFSSHSPRISWNRRNTR